MSTKPRLLLSMVVKNEENRYLHRALEHHLPFVDHVVIVDDASTDGTIELCKKLLKNTPYTLIENEHSMFTNEVQLRQKQWNEAVKLKPEWILNLDADEIFESGFEQEIGNILTHDHYDAVYFRLYDMWSETHYRDDDYWQAHHYYRPFLIRYRDELTYSWNNSPLHCGRFPNTISHFPYTCHSARIKHYGWAQENDRKRKYERYKKLDPDAIYGWKEQYESILDPTPNLVKWED